MVQWLSLLIAVLAFEDVRKHREWQRQKAQ